MKLLCQGIIAACWMLILFALAATLCAQSFDGNGALEAFYTQGGTRELSRAWSCGLLDASKIRMEGESQNPEAKALLAVIDTEWKRAGCGALRARILTWMETVKTKALYDPWIYGTAAAKPLHCKPGSGYVETDTDFVWSCSDGKVWRLKK